MSTLNKYAAAARCIRRQRVLKKNAAVAKCIRRMRVKAAWVKQAEENAEEAKKRRRSRLLRGLGIGASIVGLGGLAYYYLKKHPELTWKSRSDVLKAKSGDEVLAAPLLGDPKPGNRPLPADAMSVSTSEPHVADAERYASNNPDIVKEVMRRLRHADNGRNVSSMMRWSGRCEPIGAGCSYDKYERAIDYEGLYTPEYNMDLANPLNVDYDLSDTAYITYKGDGPEAIQAREAAELEAFKKRYPEQFQEQNDHD